MVLPLPDDETLTIPNMRVLILNFEYPPFGGGAASATHFMARDLARCGWEVVVLTSGTKHAPAVEFSHGVEIHRVASWRRGVHDTGFLGAASYLFFARLRLRRLLQERDFDVAHFFFALPTGLLSFYWRAKTACPYVVSLRGSDVPRYDGGSRSLRLFHRLLLGANRRILCNAHAVVANSHALRALALQSFPEQTIGVVSNGVCAETFRPVATRQCGDTVTVICVARLIKRKGIKDALHALALTNNVKLRLQLVGVGPHENELRQLAERLQVADRVEFLGHLQGKALARAYRDADILLLASVSESCSMALLEGMASGLPVLATQAGGTPELVVNGENGLLIPHSDPHSLAAGLDCLAGSPELRHRFGASNRIKIEHSFGWPAIVQRYMNEFYGQKPSRPTGCAP